MIFLKRRALMTRASFNYKTVSGIGSAVLENCVETKFKRLSLLGNSAQGENPSIESPKEIKNSGKYDEVSEKYLIDVKVTGNLFNYTKAKSGWIATSDGKQSLVALGGSDNVVSDYIPVHSGMIYTSSAGVYKYFYDSEKNFLKYETLSSSIIIPNNVKYMIVIVPVNRAIVIQTAKKLIIYESDSEQQTLQLQLDEPLRGIGEYKDVITKDGILRRIKEIVLDENTGFETYWATLNKTFAFISPTIKDATVINGTPNRLLCNYSKALPDGLDRTDEEVCVLFNRRFHIRFLKERNVDTVEKLKEWLKQNPIKIQYLLQEPVLETFENRLENLHANDGTTIITVDSGEVQTGIEVEYAVKE